MPTVLRTINTGVYEPDQSGHCQIRGDPSGKGHTCNAELGLYNSRYNSMSLLQWKGGCIRDRQPCIQSHLHRGSSFAKDITILIFTVSLKWGRCS